MRHITPKDTCIMYMQAYILYTFLYAEVAIDFDNLHKLQKYVYIVSWLGRYMWF